MDGLIWALVRLPGLRSSWLRDGGEEGDSVGASEGQTGIGQGGQWDRQVIGGGSERVSGDRVSAEAG